MGKISPEMEFEMMNGIKKALVFVWGAGYASGIFLISMSGVVNSRLWMVLLVILVALTTLLIVVFTANWFADNWKSD